MDKRLKSQLRVIEEAIYPLDWRVVGYTKKGKHYKVHISDGEITRKLVMSQSPSDHRATKNLASTARNICKGVYTNAKAS